MAITPGGRVGDASPLGTHGPRRLDDYVREVAHALIRKGYSKSHAIAVAKNSLKRWRRGGGHVRPQVRAGAAAHLGIQEGLDKSRSFNMANSLASSQDGPRGTVASVASPAFGGKKAAPFKKGGGKAKLRPGSIPAGKGRGKFPITDQKSVKSAASLLSKAKGVSKQAVVAHVRAEAKRRGLKLTPAFKPKQTDSSNVFDLVGPKGYSHGWIRASGPLPRGKRGRDLKPGSQVQDVQTGRTGVLVAHNPHGDHSVVQFGQRKVVQSKYASTLIHRSRLRPVGGSGKSRAAVGLVPSGARTKASAKRVPSSYRGTHTQEPATYGGRGSDRRDVMAGHAAPTPELTGMSPQALREALHTAPDRKTALPIMAEMKRQGIQGYTAADLRDRAVKLSNASTAEARKKVADALRNSPTTSGRAQHGGLSPSTVGAIRAQNEAASREAVHKMDTRKLEAMLSDRRYASWRGLVQAELDRRKAR